jgi:ABC-2 type transport system permease protein
MGGSGIAMALFSGQVDTTDKKIAVLDHSGIATEVLIKAAEARNEAEVLDKETGKKVKPAYVIEPLEPNTEDPLAQRLELSNRVREGSLHAFLEIGPTVLHPEQDRESARIGYYAKSAAMDPVRNWIESPLNTYLRQARLAEAGVEEGKRNEILTWISIAPLGLVSVDDSGLVKDARRTSEAEAILAPLILFFLFFMMIMMGAMPLLQAIMEEKTARIAEVLLGYVKPFQFMAGKVLGGMFVSLTGAAFYFICGSIGLTLAGWTEYIPYHIMPWFFTFMVLAILMYGSILAALGSACNDSKDAQNLTFPAMIPVFIPMFLMMPVLQEPTSNFATVLSLFPPFTPMLMLLRISSPTGIPAWQPWVGLVGVVLFTIFSIWAGGRIFRIGILMMGQPPRIGNLIRWAIRG